MYGPPPGAQPASPPTARRQQPRALTEGIDTIRERLQRCYLRRVRRVPNLSRGPITVRWVIDTRGRARDVTIVGGNITDAWMRRCVVNQVERVRYDPPPPRDHPVTTSFTFAATR